MTTPSGLARTPSNDVVRHNELEAVRRRKLAGVPYCEACNAIGRLVPATVVDHVVAVSAGGPMYPRLDQLMSVCAPYHNSKTRRVEQGGLPNVIKGCDANGLPVDASHPFYGAKPVYPSRDQQLSRAERACRRARVVLADQLGGLEGRTRRKRRDPHCAKASPLWVWEARRPEMAPFGRFVEPVRNALGGNQSISSSIGSPGLRRRRGASMTPLRLRSRSRMAMITASGARAGHGPSMITLKAPRAGPFCCHSRARPVSKSQKVQLKR
jgi:hypothetical protein